MSVYFLRPIGMDGPIKIGFSDQPERRLKEMAMWSPFPLEIIAVVPGGKYLEGRLHAAFADVRLHWEWFKPIPDLKLAIRRLAAGMSARQAFDRHRILRRNLPPSRALPAWPPQAEARP